MKIVRHFAIIFTTIILFLGGIGYNLLPVEIIAVLISCYLCLLAAVGNKRFLLPKGFGVFVLFLAALVAHSYWEEKILVTNYFIMYLAGGLFWIAFYNLRSYFEKYYGLMIVLLAIAFGLLFFLFAKGGDIGTWSLFLTSSTYKNHNHIGDIWALALAVIFYTSLNKAKLWHFLLGLVGVYLMAISLSRSAYAALFAGVIFVAFRKGWIKKARYVSLATLTVCAALLVYAGTQKTTLFARPYYIQAVVGFLRNPLGVGMGNFSIISADPINHLLGFKDFAGFTHNIVLEVLVGLGIFSLPFIIWFFLVCRSVWQKSKTRLFSSMIFVVLSVNLLLDSTYNIPTMLWLWFMSIGLAQAEE